MGTALESAVLGRLVAARAEAEPDRLAFVFENGELAAERLTLGELATAGNRFAHELRRAGLERGDRVAIMLRNHPEFVVALTANSKLGLATVPIDPRSRGEKLRYFLRFAECRGLVTADYVVADPAAAGVIRGAGVRTWVVSTPEGRGRAWPPPASPASTMLPAVRRGPRSVRPWTTPALPGCSPIHRAPPAIPRRSSSGMTGCSSTAWCPASSATGRTTSSTPASPSPTATRWW